MNIDNPVVSWSFFGREVVVVVAVVLVTWRTFGNIVMKIVRECDSGLAISKVLMSTV